MVVIGVMTSGIHCFSLKSEIEILILKLFGEIFRLFIIYILIILYIASHKNSEIEILILKLILLKYFVYLLFIFLLFYKIT